MRFWRGVWVLEDEKKVKSNTAQSGFGSGCLNLGMDWVDKAKQEAANEIQSMEDETF